MGPKPSVSHFTLCQRFRALRDDPDHAGLKAYPFHCVRYSLKYLADAYARYKVDPVNEGRPRFKARHFTIPSDVQIGDGPWDRGSCTARGDPMGDPDDP